jgi:hypothetical protein
MPVEVLALPAHLAHHDAWKDERTANGISGK